MHRFLFTLLSLALVSEEEARFIPVYKQGYDSSCGIAATASLLDTYWNIPITEVDLYQDMIINRLDGTKASYTISFSTIIESLKPYSIASRGYKMDWDTLTDSLAKDYAPILINYHKPRPHFALLLGIRDGFALVADPAQGMGLVSRSVFEEKYSGNALLTASSRVQKNGSYLEQVIQDETRRLQGLERLAAGRRIRGRL